MRGLRGIGRSSGRRRGMVLVALLPAAAGCRGGGGKQIRAERRVALPATVGDSAALRVDASGREWVIGPGRVVLIDAGRAPKPARITTSLGAPLPIPATDPAGRLYAERAGAAFALAAARAGVTAPPLRADAPVARNPRGGWYYVGTRVGGVLGVGADSLRILWGWPEMGGRVTALAASPLGDRVYVALGPRTADDEFTPRVAVLDAQSGRMLDGASLTYPALAIFAGADGWVRGYAGADERAELFALAPSAKGLTLRWRVSLRRLGVPLPASVRVSPSGTRVVVFSRASGGVRVLDGVTGALVGRVNESPLDAAFDAGGQLHLLYPNRTARLP